MMRAILTVCRKEILDNSRDKRTFFTAIVLGPLLGPIVCVSVFNLTISQAVPSVVSSVEKPITVPIVGAEHAPNLVAFLASQGIHTTEDHALANIGEAVRAVEARAMGVVVVVEDSFGEELASGAGGRVSVIHDRSESSSSQPARRVSGEIRTYSAQIGSLRLLARGLDPFVMRPLIVDSIDVSTARQRSDDMSIYIFGMLSYFLLFGMLVGGLYLATDTTAGERERKSLEPLLSTPVPRSSLLLGKMSATSSYMLLTLALSLACISVALRFVSIEELRISASLDAGSALAAFAILVPFAPLGAALMTLVASFTKSYKEAQTYLGFVILIPTMPLIVASILNPKPSLALMAVPSLSQHLLISRLAQAEPIEASHAGCIRDVFVAGGGAVRVCRHTPL